MRQVGTILLAAWLIFTGLQGVADLHFRYDNIALGVLAIVTGIFLIMRR